MQRNHGPLLARAIAAFVVIVSAEGVAAWDPLPVANDPLLRMPGTQPRQITLESQTRCSSCHSGYDATVEPFTNWRGSMMGQAARDFLFFSAVTVAGQDSIWGLGNPNAVDLCERCHFPKGWLEGRSDPPNASAMTGEDYDGVPCVLCHSLYDPRFEDAYAGTREGNDWLNYWDETNLSGTKSSSAAASTLAADRLLAPSIMRFNGTQFFGADFKPASPTYTEAAGGQYFSTSSRDKRAPFADAEAKSHSIAYSRYHKSKYLCAVCHDVSNPALANLGADITSPLPSEQKSASTYFHVERTFSEFALSAYGQAGGSAGLGPYTPGVFDTSKPGDLIATCQDCHLPDASGRAANKSSALLRTGDPSTTQSLEHPQSAQPVHDLTGGNAWVTAVLASTISGSAIYDPVNATLLSQGPGVLTLDLTQGMGLDPTALLSGANRALQQLTRAASLSNLVYDGVTGALSFRIQNQTGHKLISGFPEGRRAFVNIKAFDSGGQLIREINPYDAIAGTLKGLPGEAYDDPQGVLPSPSALAPSESYSDSLVYEMHPSSSLTGEEKTLHFVLADGRYKDNRIPPKGFRIAEAAARQAQPVWHGRTDEGYFTAAEYSGGYDDVAVTIEPAAASVVVTLYYQTTSREYIEFLRDEINGSGATLPGPGAAGDSAYLVQTDPFFSKLKTWGTTIWSLWAHNKDKPGAAPVTLVTATKATPTSPISQLDLQGGQLTLTWASIPNAQQYEVWEFGSPYAIPDAQCLPAQNCTVTTARAMNLAVASPPASMFYTVVTAASDGSRGAISNRTGVIPFVLTTGGVN